MGRGDEDGQEVRFRTTRVEQVPDAFSDRVGGERMLGQGGGGPDGGGHTSSLHHPACTMRSGATRRGRILADQEVTGSMTVKGTMTTSSPEPTRQCASTVPGPSKSISPRTRR